MKVYILWQKNRVARERDLVKVFSTRVLADKALEDRKRRDEDLIEYIWITELKVEEC